LGEHQLLRGVLKVFHKGDAVLVIVEAQDGLPLLVGKQSVVGVPGLGVGAAGAMSKGRDGGDTETLLGIPGLPILVGMIDVVAPERLPLKVGISHHLGGLLDRDAHERTFGLQSGFVLVLIVDEPLCESIDGIVSGLSRGNEQQGRNFRGELGPADLP
jgi:hypothetical protein